MMIAKIAVRCIAPFAIQVSMVSSQQCLTEIFQSVSVINFTRAARGKEQFYHSDQKPRLQFLVKFHYFPIHKRQNEVE